MSIIPIKTINIKGKAERLVADHQSTRTAYNKEPISTPDIYLTLTGFKGDTVVHTKYHGGNDKAICCYNADRFKYWNETLNLDLQSGAFGENLTLEGDDALEENVFIGDRYQLGEAVVEVSEPRGPCYIIGIRHNLKQFPALCQETGFTGFYLRTIKPGKVNVTDKLVKIYSHPAKISVMDINRIRYHDNKNKTWLEKLVALQELTAEWRERFQVLLNKLK